MQVNVYAPADDGRKNHDMTITRSAADSGFDSARHGRVHPAHCVIVFVYGTYLFSDFYFDCDLEYHDGSGISPHSIHHLNTSMVGLRTFIFLFLQISCGLYSRFFAFSSHRRPMFHLYEA